MANLRAGLVPQVFVVFCLLVLTDEADCIQRIHRGHRKEKTETEITCGYASCPKYDPDLINVHIVSHTHDDVGWLKTVDQYYYGSRNNIQQAGVQYILDSVIAALNENPDRKFIYVETAFLWRWLQEQDDKTIANLKDLVNQGRLTIINGAWSMNDEATTHYSSIIENYAWGLRRLNDVFGSCGRPTVGWQIDPFGHSREFAFLLSQMGFDGMFIGRLDYQDKVTREANHTMEMLWRGSQTLGDSSNLFTGVLPNGYSPPAGFCFDMLCRNDPVMDDKRLLDFNVDKLVENFSNAMNAQAAVYGTNHVIATMGEDFNYMDAEMWFKNLDKLIKYVNEQQTNGSKINLLYSTPACYLSALNQITPRTWPVKTDDFFPYASGPHSYWTGYFTSRPAVKRFERVASAFLPVCKQVSYLSKLGPTQMDAITVLRQALAVAQHHDAVAGTEKQEVAFDYAQRLDVGMKSCQKAMSDGLAKLANITAADISYCDLLNVSSCTATETYKNLAVVLWNPLARPTKQYFHLPVPDGNYILTGPGGSEVQFQLTPLFYSREHLQSSTSLATQQLTFYADLPAMGPAVYGLTRSADQNKDNQAKVYTKSIDDNDVVFQNDHISATFDIVTGLLKSITNMESNDKIVINQTFAFYKGMEGNNSLEDHRASGAYIFRPNCTELGPDCKIVLSGETTYEIAQGALVQEIRQHYNPWVSQVIRLYANARYLEFEWQVGPIPVNDNVGKEVVSWFCSDIKSSATFYTDSNGRQNIERVRNSRETFQLNITEPSSGNYYPVTNRIFIRDAEKATQLTILTDRAQGGSSLQDGQLELMVHRRLLYDDDFGVGEALNEPGDDGAGLVVRGKQYLLFSKTATAASDYRVRNQEIYWHPSPAFVRMDELDTVTVLQKKIRTNTATPNLPANVHLLSLEWWTDSSIILRLEHLFEADEDAVLSNPVTVDLQDLIPDHIGAVDEMSLDGNAPLSSIRRLKWNTVKRASYNRVRRSRTGSFNVTIKPMEIRTFQITFGDII